MFLTHVPRLADLMIREDGSGPGLFEILTRPEAEESSSINTADGTEVKSYWMTE